jgi:hypothetical protein
MFKNETGLQVLEPGDVVKVGNGKVLYSVVNEASPDNYNIQSHNTGKFKFEARERLTLVTDVRDTDEWQAANEEYSEPVEDLYRESPNFGLGPEEEEVEASPEPDSYALAIFVALQRKPIFQGFLNPLKKRKVRASRRLRKLAKNARRAQRAA